ncbi:MAG: hypothetical protein Q9213_007465 [Squamulea squamosa]
MSSTTEDSDWGNTIVPQSRRPSTNSQSSNRRKEKSRPTPQPILPRIGGPGQSVFPVSAPIQYVPPVSINPITYRHPQYQNVNPIPLGTPSFSPPVYPSLLSIPSYPNPVNPIPLTAPSYAPPVNPAFARVINEHIPNQSTNITPSTWDPPQQSTTSQTDTPPQYITPPSRSIRGVKSGARRARGGRKPPLKAEHANNGDISMVVSTPTEGRGGSRAGGSSSRGAKRKRDDEDEKDDSDVSEIITPLPTQSRSGRKIIHANNFSPVVIDLEENAKSTAPAKNIKATSNIPEPPEPTVRRGKKRASKTGETSVCKNCGRGHSPAANMIVFCDGCNGPWHQFCHDPPISQDVIRIEEEEWLCADCQILREEKSHVEGKVGAPALSIVEKRRYLQTLSPGNLVSLLLHGTVLHPELPIFATPSGGPLPERRKRPITHFVDPTVPIDEEDDDLYPESEPLPYPKPGNGVPLPSEGDNLALLIDEDVGVYSHVWDWEKMNLECDGEKV